MYFPSWGLQTTIWFCGSKHWRVKSDTLNDSWELLAAEMTGA